MKKIFISAALALSVVSIFISFHVVSSCLEALDSKMIFSRVESLTEGESGYEDYYQTMAYCSMFRLDYACTRKYTSEWCYMPNCIK